ncbi:hypothetical protein FRX31_009597 [Thalictrum thalictroides]|uniref:Uncharacterized protein n=1 Tax=Thalictrum thalictroides TaxID=46969 RepID=A0A7J6WXH9_THATH|nr:hypothetical protein FRX31_009597 [Thalictrum thalictroides]
MASSSSDSLLIQSDVEEDVMEVDGPDDVMLYEAAVNKVFNQVFTAEARGFFPLSWGTYVTLQDVPLPSQNASPFSHSMGTHIFSQ